MRPTKAKAVFLFDVDNTLLDNDRVIEDLKRYLAREMYITAFNIDESDRVFAKTDPEVERAVDAMPKARALVETARKVLVQRMSSQQQASLGNR